jgi:hypothetical protein
MRGRLDAVHRVEKAPVNARVILEGMLTQATASAGH